MPSGRLIRSITPASLRKLADEWRTQPEYGSRSAAINDLLKLADSLEARRSA